MAEALVRTAIPPIADPVSWAERHQAQLLFEQFDLATRRVRRTVIGLTAEHVVTPDLDTSLRRGLDRRRTAGLLAVFAGSEALRGERTPGAGGFPNHVVMRLVRYIEIDHGDGSAVLVGQADATPDAVPAEGAGRPTPGDLPKEESREWRQDADFDLYSGRMRTIRQAARDGKVGGAVLSLGLERRTSASPFAIYERIVARNPSPFGYVFLSGRHALVGSSPLAFLLVRGQRLHLETDAGTRPVTGVREQDDLAAADLASNLKDASEHAVVVDAEREAMASIAKGGIVETVIDRQVRRFSHVMHLYTTLQADLAEGLDLADAILALAPAAAVSGLPKRTATEIGVAAEGGPRGPYGGVIGIVDPHSGAADLAVVIRSLWLSDGVARLRVGGKIVPHSEPESEYRECLAKSRFLVEGIEAAERAILDGAS